MPVRMTREGRAETREAKRTEQNNQQSKSGKAAGFSSTSQKGNIVHGKLKSQKELKKITGSEDYKKSDYEGKTKMLNVATANKGMSVKQKKLAAKAPPPNKIDAKDFAVLRAEKAKGRGMGLQDESVKPGKVMKAKRGKMFDGYLSTFDASAEASTPKAQRGVTTIVGVRPGAKIGKGKKKFKSMEAMRTAKGFRTIDGKQETSSEFNKRRMKLAGAKKALASTRISKIVLPIAAAGVAAQQYLKGKMKKDKNKKTLKDFREQKKPGVPSEKTKTINSALNKLKAKKMGGGMMQKPMGYKSGMGPAGAAGSMAGRPGGRRPMQQGPKGGIGSLSKNRSNDDLLILVNTGDGKIKKMKRSEFKDNMSAPEKKMGGGMMQKPMGYNKGVMVKARGCKLGRTRPTRIT